MMRATRCTMSIRHMHATRNRKTPTIQSIAIANEMSDHDYYERFVRFEGWLFYWLPASHLRRCALRLDARGKRCL